MTALAMPHAGEVWRDRAGKRPITIEEVGISRALVSYGHGLTSWLSSVTLHELYEPTVRARHDVLGSTAVYEKVADDGVLVTVEVVECVGLMPGTRLHFTRKAFELMERV